MRLSSREAALWGLALLGAPGVGGLDVIPRETGSSFRPAFAQYEEAALAKRQQDCPNGYFSCANIGQVFAGICCFAGSSCAQDERGQPACCPLSAICTGTAPPAIPTGANGGNALSFVPNSFYPFPFMATSFAGPAGCTAAIRQCSETYTSCILDLEGVGGRPPGYGVTISVIGGGGTTVAGPTVTLAPSAAVSVCSSLSQVSSYSSLFHSYCILFYSIFPGHMPMLFLASCTLFMRMPANRRPQVGCYGVETSHCTLPNGGGILTVGSSAHKAVRPSLLLAASFGLGVFLVLRHVL